MWSDVITIHSLRFSVPSLLMILHGERERERKGEFPWWVRPEWQFKYILQSSHGLASQSSGAFTGPVSIASLRSAERGIISTSFKTIPPQSFTHIPIKKEKKITFFIRPPPPPRPRRPCTSFCIEENFYALLFFFPTLLLWPFSDCVSFYSLVPYDVNEQIVNTNLGSSKIFILLKKRDTHGVYQ